MKRRLRSRRGAHPDILVPTDGSAPSRRAIEEAALLARRLGVAVVGVHVVTPYQAYSHHAAGPDRLTAAQFEKVANAAARRYLDAVGRAAARQGVACRCHTIWDTSAADAIVDAGVREGCGLIVMASHGRTGLKRLLLGSITQKVLAQSRVPVVVCR
jgi:nucleotide-binding universal stress UspA family protein